MSTNSCQTICLSLPHPVPPNLFRHIYASLSVFILVFALHSFWQLLNFTFQALFFFNTDFPTWLLVLLAVSFLYFIPFPGMIMSPNSSPHTFGFSTPNSNRCECTCLSCSLGNDLTVKTDLSLL